MNKRILAAAWATIGLLLIMIPTLVLEYFRSQYQQSAGFAIIYILNYFVALLLTILFVLGFEIIARKAKVSMLAHSAYAILVLTVLVSFYYITALFVPALENIVISVLILIAIGLIYIVFGTAVLKLRKKLKGTAAAAGTMLIITGVAFVTVILSPIGIILSIPAMILEAVLLFKAAKKF